MKPLSHRGIWADLWRCILFVTLHVLYTETVMLLVNHWYALFVRSHCEQVIARALAEKAYEPFVPTYKVSRGSADRIYVQELPLFANYVFCKVTGSSTGPIVTTTGVLRIVGNGKQPIPVADQEILALQRIAQSGLPSAPWPFPRIGQVVQVECGPLSGMSGVICRIGNVNRLIVSVKILNRSVAVHLDREALRLISDEEPVLEMA